MDTNKLYNSILTIGCDFKHPKGGVAQVINTYSSFSPSFRFICTTKETSQLGKIFQLVYAIIKFVGLCMFCKQIKIIHIHGASYHSFFRKCIFIFIGHAFKKQIIYHVHGGEFHIFSVAHKKAVAATLKKVDCIITLSQYWKDFFEKEFRHPNVKILPNVIPDRVYNERDIKFPLHALFLGTLGEKKGIYDLLQVLTMHKEELAGKFILHVGGNGETEKVQHYIESEGIQHIVRFEGWVSGEKKTKLLTRCHFYILPSYAEGLPISILEAMSYQMPILATPVGGIPEVVKNGINGFLDEPGNHEGLYQHIHFLLSHPSLIKKMGDQSYAIVKPHFAEEVKKQLEKIYLELLH
jgi:hypothetical protein